ncbi:hypothetical protein FRC10_006588, partial [Ceratobasidium sp. 414]
MDANSSSADTVSRPPIPEATKEAIRTAVFSKAPADRLLLLGLFLKSLKASGYEPPEFLTIMSGLGEGFGPLGLDEVLSGSRDLFEVLNHKIFDGMFAAPPKKQTPKKQIQTEAPFSVGGDQLLATEKAWTVPYAGPAPSLLRKAMDQMNTQRHLSDYANFLPIIQSSGMGKSRTVDELARQVFTLPFNFRPTSDKTGYPKGDLDITGWLSGNSLRASEVRVRYRIFFEELFLAVYDVLKGWEVHSSPEELANAFRTWLLGEREKFYTKIQRK